MVGVVGALFEPGQFVEGAPPLAALGSATDLDDLANALVPADAPLVVIYPAWRAEPFRRRLETIRAALDRGTVAAHASALPPLAGAVLVSLAAALGAYAESAALLAGALPALEREIVPLGWLSSVARLRNPRPRLLDRLRSSLPGSGFVVRAGAEPAIVAGAHDAASLPVREIYTDACVAVTEGGPEAGAWLGPAVSQLFDGAPLLAVEPAKDLAGWWGSARVVEAVAYPTDVAALAEELLAGAVPCPWCGEPVLTRPCPVCGHDYNRGVAAPLEETAA